jgi:hypothetical protein
MVGLQRTCHPQGRYATERGSELQSICQSEDHTGGCIDVELTAEVGRIQNSMGGDPDLNSNTIASTTELKADGTAAGGAVITHAEPEVEPPVHKAASLFALAQLLDAGNHIQTRMQEKINIVTRLLKRQVEQAQLFGETATSAGVADWIVLASIKCERCLHGSLLVRRGAAMRYSVLAGLCADSRFRSVYIKKFDVRIVVGEKRRRNAPFRACKALCK